MMNNEELQLPSGFKPLENQVAGHTFTAPLADNNSSSVALGLLQCKDSGFVLKPFGKPECGKREHQFYENIKEAKDQLLKQAEHFIPKYFGLCRLYVKRKEYEFLKLEDLTHGLSKCNIMDCKIGKRTWDPVATPQKRAVEEEKYVKCKKSLGLCLPGFQMFDLETNEMKRYSKEYGKKLDSNGFRETMAMFLYSTTSVCEPLVAEVLRQLYEIKKWFDIQTYYHFYASSLLIVYDVEGVERTKLKFLATNGEYVQENLKAINANDMNQCTQKNNGNSITNKTQPRKIMVNGDDCESSDESFQSCSIKHVNLCNQSYNSTYTKDLSHCVKVRMIDFAHVFETENGTRDENYLFGLNNLIEILEDILKNEGKH